MVPSGIETAIGERPCDHLIEGWGERCAEKAASSAAGAPVAPNPINTVCGTPCASRRVSPPKYEDAGVVGAVVDAGAEPRDFSTRWARVDCSIPVPSTATLPLVKAEAAKDLTSPAVMELWEDAKREEPRPERKARAWASSMACVASAVEAA